jgi:hypothetical protein
MAPRETQDFKELLKRAKKLIGDGSAKSFTDLAQLLKVNQSTLRVGFRRNFDIQTVDDILKFVSDGFEATNLIGSENADKLEVNIDGNQGKIRSVIVEGQIKTIEQLLKLAGVGKEYYVHNPKIKKWDVALKRKVGKDEEVIEVVPSIYIEAPLRKKNPIAFEPVIAPIHIELPKLPKMKSNKQGGVKRGLIINDTQFGFRRTLHTTQLHPFHDRRVLDLALQICQTEQIDHISHGGDLADLSEWSNKFLAEPEFYWTTQPALLETAWWLTQFRLARPNAEMKILEGNHDLRMPILITSNLRQAYKIKAVDEMELPPQMTIPRLLALHKLNIDYVNGYPDNGYWLNSNVYITHGDLVRGTPGRTANALTARQAFTTIFGHIHRRESVTRRMKVHDGDLIYTAFCPGCACHIDGRVPGSKSSDQWQQGLAIIEYSEDSENIIPISISDGTMIYGGKVWKARDREVEINQFLTESLESVAV